MNNLKSILWGIVFIIIGLFIALCSFDVLDIDVFFSGWWTMFIIIPCLIEFITENDKFNSLIGIIIGIVLLLACNDVIDFSIVWKLIVPAIFILIGVSCIFKNIIMNNIKNNIKEIPKENGCSAIFSENKVNYDDQKFEGIEVTAIFGGVELDLRKAKINDDVVIDITSVFGGVDIMIPRNCKVKITSSSIFGGVDNKVKDNEVTDKSKTIFINANCVFGGVDIK